MYYIGMEITIKIPENLGEITLGQYQKYLKMQKETEDEIFIAQKMIEIFCETRLDHVMKMKWRDVQDITLDLANMFEQDQKMRKQFTLDNVNYGFIPNLDEITFGEFVDLDSNLSEWDDMHKAMQVLYRPIDINVRGRYNIKEYDGKIDDSMKDMPLSIALGAVFFFVEFRKRVVSSYDGLFTEGSSEGAYSSQGGFNKKWGWYSSFHKAAQGDVTRFENISELGVHKVLMYLEYENEKATLENQKIKRKYGSK